jgi:alpha,alpha-trehalase
MAEDRKWLDPDRLDALLVDLDGVITDTAAVHASAWKALFDEYLRSHAERHGIPFKPFDAKYDYLHFVDGKPRYDGVRSFLTSRGITLQEGNPDDLAESETVCGLGNRKNTHFRRLLARLGVHVWDTSVDLINTARARGLKVAVVSSSKNCAMVLATAGLNDIFDARVDGAERERLKLAGKPAPDTFLEAARRLDVRPERAAVIEDALVGVQAGRNAGFGLVIGVDRGEQPDVFKEHGADLVVNDLGELAIGAGPKVHRKIPLALQSMDDITRRIDGRRVAVFLDYDGTLTPIVARPDLAILSESMRETLDALADQCVVVVVSGRRRDNVTKLVNLPRLIYVGSHGFDIAGPGGLDTWNREAEPFVPIIAEAEQEIRGKIGQIDGALVEGKIYAVAVHYRLVAEHDVPFIEAAVDEVVARHPKLRKTGGKKVFEVRPRMDWDKGKAVLWLLDALDLGGPDVTPFYLGDDLTDEDAFTALKGRGIGILVSDRLLPTAADYRLRDPDEVRAFLEALSEVLKVRQR